MKNLMAMLSLACVCFAGYPAFGQGTAFTYQGQLQNNGNLANGTYNYTFSLFNAIVGGPASAGPVTNTGVLVSNGLFTVLIDFGPSVFIGGTNWLEIGVESNGVSAFTTLTPRQQLTPTPYAITASSALSAGTITSAVPNTALNGSYTLPVTINNPSNSFGGSFNGNGSGLTNLNASHITGGAISNVSSINVPTANITNLEINGSVAFANPKLSLNPFTLENIYSSVSGAALFASAPNNVTAFDLEPGTGPVADTGYGLAHMDICNTNVQANSYLEPASWISIAASTNAHFISSRSYGGAPILPFWLGFGASPVLEFSNGSPATVTAIGDVSINGSLSVADSIAAGDVSINGSLSVADSIAAGTLTLPAGTGTIYSGTELLLREDRLQNFFAGGGAGNVTLTGTANTGLGYGALPNNTTGSYNTASGFLALHYNTSGANDTAIGTGALYFNTNGSYDIAIGDGALYSNTIGSYSTAEGVYALYDNTTGNFNTANGYQSLNSNTTGSRNIALGFQAGLNVTTGSSNIDIGSVGAATDTNIVRIGSSQTQTYLAGVINGDGAGLTNVNVSASQLIGAVGNSQLANDSIVINAGTGLSGGGTVPLGGSTTLINAGVLSVTGNSDIMASTVGGAVTLGDTATSAPTANLIVKRDGTGSFSTENLTLNGVLNLPSTAVNPDIIYSGNDLLLYGDNNGNFFSGQNAGESTTTGNVNTANGYLALSGNTTGSNNIALGYQAGSGLTTGSSNIDIGSVGAATDTNIIRIGVGQTQAVIAGVVTSTSGFASYASNGGSPTTIKVQKSPFTYTNTSLQNIEVFIGGGTVKAYAVNGTTVASGLTLSGLTTVLLENNETLEVTYSVAPIMTFLAR